MQPPEVSSSVTHYTGKIKYPCDDEQQDLHTMEFGEAVPLNSDTSGLISNVYGCAPNGTSDWNSLASVFEEYRVLGFQVEYFPNNRYSKSAVICVPLLGCVDRQSATSILTYAAMMTHASHKRLSLEDPWVIVAKMDNAEEAVFQSTSGPADLYWIKFVSVGNTTSTTYGQLFITYRVQFRGRA